MSDLLSVSLQQRSTFNNDDIFRNILLIEFCMVFLRCCPYCDTPYLKPVLNEFCLLLFEWSEKRVLTSDTADKYKIQNSLMKWMNRYLCIVFKCRQGIHLLLHVLSPTTIHARWRHYMLLVTIWVSARICLRAIHSVSCYER